MADFVAGETALIAAVPEAEPVVGEWRSRFDPSVAYGVPAHVTILYPFLRADRIDAGMLADLRALFAAHAPFDVRFSGCGRFPEVLYLAPDPGRPFADLTEAVAARWPEAPPYGGRFDEVVPHLTVADGVPVDVQDTIEAGLAAGLPVAAHVSSVSLHSYDGTIWRNVACFPLGEPS
ncbi:2'-5' RNA ligase family protein [Planotetraspora thailandica]|uniref:2'-5' RNA ligase family protein n=1 Tax=Planotetraspora thailandica TaxID=487172 RepID=UPI001951B0F3|nr:2'-5' RNA ligase family protein [Planotetraspora thailandica]